MTKIAGFGSASGSECGSGSNSQRHGSSDLDPDPDPHQNVMDPQHCSEEYDISYLEVEPGLATCGTPPHAPQSDVHAHFCSILGIEVVCCLIRVFCHACDHSKRIFAEATVAVVQIKNRVVDQGPFKFRTFQAGSIST
jgi:hypothetical protein